MGTLSPSRVQLLQDRKSRLYFSSISLWEIAKLYEYQRIRFRSDLGSFLGILENHPSYQPIPIETSILMKMIEISPRMHRDPADQLIVATTLSLGARLMTDDRQIRALDWVESA